MEPCRGDIEQRHPDQLNLYLNGVLIRSSTNSQVDVDWTMFTDITIGSRTDGANAFVGSLDDVRIYNSELSGSDINDIMVEEGGLTETVAITVNAVNDTPDVVGPGISVASDRTDGTEYSWSGI